MTRTRIAALTLAAVALAGGTTWALGVEPETARFGTTEVAVQQVLPVSPSPSPATSGRTVPKKAPENRPGAAPTRPGRHVAPAPFVQTFAAQPGVTRQKPKRRPTAPVKVATAVDGCDRNYGTIAHCIPVRFPPGVTDKCAWLRDHGYQGIKVATRDRQGLDPDRNGVICDR